LGEGFSFFLEKGLRMKLSYDNVLFCGAQQNACIKLLFVDNLLRSFEDCKDNGVVSDDDFRQAWFWLNRLGWLQYHSLSKCLEVEPHVLFGWDEQVSIGLSAIPQLEQWSKEVVFATGCQILIKEAQETRESAG
jgi:hypothetical protein